MGFLDDTVNEFEQLAKEHPEEARAGLEKAEELVDEHTGGQYSDQIKAGGDQAESFLGIQDQQAGQGDQTQQNS